MFSWCWFELMINCSSTLCFLPTSSSFRKIFICGLHYCWLQLLSCLGFSFCRSTIYIRTVDCSCSSKCWLCKQCPGFLFLSSVKSGPQLMCWCLHSCLPSFCSKKRPSSRVSSVFVRHILFLFAFLFRIAQCMTQTCEDHCDLWVLWSSLYVNCALVTGKVFKRQQKPELAPGV